jgi:hypothetical protein
LPSTISQALTGATLISQKLPRSRPMPEPASALEKARHRKKLMPAGPMKASAHVMLKYIED